MGHSKISIPIAGTVAAILSLTACSDENPWGNQTNETASIHLSLSTDNEVATTKPMFRSGEESDGRKRLGTVTNLPQPEDFSIRLEKSDGSFTKTWATLADFNDDAMHGNFKIGTYTITAFYGEKGKQDFDAPYMEASSTITLLAGQEEDIALNAELKNSVVKVNYTEGFQNYMDDYYSSLRTEGRSDDIIYTKDETRAAFIEPIDAALSVNFTTHDKGYNGKVLVGEFAPLAKTLHNVTLDVTENTDGNATLQVTFDDSLEEETVSIDLTEELFTTPAPVITCEGFTDGGTVDLLEGNASDTSISMKVNAEGTIAKANLIVESDNYTPSWGREIDLCSATDAQKQQITDAGISAIGFGFKAPADKMALLDLTNYSKTLPKGIHKISLVVEDKNGAVSKTSSVTFNSMPIELSLIGEPTIVYGSGEAVLTMDYNGFDPINDISFTAVNSVGMHETAPIKSCEENTSTRAFETKRYIFTISLPNTTKSNIEIKAYYKKTKEMGKYIVPVTVPAYKISAYDAFSRYAFLKVSAIGKDDSSILAAIINNIAFKDSRLHIANRDAANGIITVTGLDPGATYVVESNITGDDNWNSNGSFVTETELAIPNGDFSQVGGTLESGSLNVGGKWHVTLLAHKQNTSSFSYNLPASWSTINELTAWAGSSNKNTWYVVPSSWLEDGKVLMRNVGYSHNGVEISESGSAAGTTYYCTNTPSDSQLEKAAGEVFLGSYSFNGTVSRNDGLAFSSRPSSISFDYNYTPLNEDHGYALIEILDSENNKLGTKTFTLSSGSGSETVKFDYSLCGRKASKLIISFKSSNQQTPPIHIPTGSELKDNKKNENAVVPTNQYKAVATGSVLTIDNVKATYASEPAKVKGVNKRKTSKRR